MTTYQQLDVPPIELEIIGGRIDFLSLGTTQISLQRIAEKVAHDMLSSEGVIAPGWNWATYPSRWFQPEYPRFVQVELAQARAGSFDSVMTFAVLSTLADPHVIAILQNLGANVIWAIGTSMLRGVVKEFRSRLPIPQRIQRNDRDPYRVEALVRDIVMAAEQNANIKAIRLRVPDAGDVILDIDFYRRQE